MKKLLVIMLVGLLTLLSLVGCGQSSGVKGDDEQKTVKLGYVNWSEGIAMTNLAAVILEDKMGYKVEQTMTDIGPVFTSVASGNTDAFMDAWLPGAHKIYMDECRDDLEDLGYNFEGAQNGLVVPSYVNIDSIEELNSIKDEVDGTIVGIDAGAGIMGATEKAIEEYGIDYKLMASSGPSMTAALSKAIAQNKAIVVTGWQPHWKFAKWDLKFLEDSKGIFGEADNIHTIARKDLSNDMPEVAEFLTNFYLSSDNLSDLMGKIESSDKEAKEVAKDWMNSHEELVNSWIPAK